MRRRALKAFVVIGVIGCSTSAFADLFHYNNVIIGERAQGLGGAYSAVADDASGVYYNPAGLAFAQSNDISGSANAIYDKKITFKNVFEGKDFVETSGGTFSPFFGAMQKLDKFVKGLVGGFAYYILDTELTDQDDLIQDAVVNETTTYHTLRRATNRRASASHLSVGAGYRLADNLSLGFTLTYLNTEDLNQTYLLIDQTADGTRSVASQNIRQKLTLYGIEPSLGLQWAPTQRVSLGLVLRKGQYASQKLVRQVDIVGFSTAGFNDSSDAKSVNPLGSPPLQMRFGVALFASPSLLVTSDVQYTGAAEDMESSYRAEYKREAVVNYAFGTE